MLLTVWNVIMFVSFASRGAFRIVESPGFPFFMRPV